MKPICSISLDLDNKWAYLKTHGDASWQTYPTYLPRVVPRFLEFFQRIGTDITVFVVGQDAVLSENREALQSIAAAGHEIGNHSFHHEPWLHEYTVTQLEHEIMSAENAIHAATGVRPVGFRGPGFSHTRQLLDVLAQSKYEYDASTFPTFLGPLARTYYFFKSRLNRKQRAQRRQLFGSWRDGFQRLRPFQWNTAYGPLVEIPVTTMPWTRTPIHFSYLMFLASRSRHLAQNYLRSALTLCRWHRLAPSLLLHPLDLLGCDDDRDLAFFPGMNLNSRYKREIFENAFALLQKHFRLVTMREHAAIAAEQPLPNHRCLREGKPCLAASPSELVEPSEMAQV